MINEENLNKIYEGLIEGKELTTKELNSYGFNSKDLSNLIENKIIERVTRGRYKLISIDKLFYYGKKLISKGEIEKATSCFEKCHELDPNHGGTCFQLFLRSIYKKDYNKAFEYFEIIHNSSNKYYKTDSNFYLYLLNIITEVPDKYKAYAKHMLMKDIQIDNQDKRYPNNLSANKVRYLSFSQKFSYAYSQLQINIKNEGKTSVQNMVVRELLNQILEIQRNKVEYIIKALQEKRYKDIIEYLEKSREQRKLNKSEEYLIILIQQLLNIQKNKRIPNITYIDTNNIFEAINNNNFKLALEISSNDKYNKDNNYIYIILKHINDEINNLQNINNYQKNNQSIVTEKQSLNKFEDVVELLIKQDIDNAIITLKKYLISIGQEKYEFLIINLIKLSLLQGDSTFIKPITTLTFISRESFNFNISEYIKDFYISLSQNKFTEARTYLDIISQSSSLGEKCAFIENLEEVLDNTEKMLGINELNQNTIETTTSTEAPIKEQPKTSPVAINNNGYDEAEKLIESKLDKLKENGIVILPKMKDERIDKITSVASILPYVEAFVIGKNNSRQVVLKYTNYTNEKIDTDELFKEATKYYNLKSYNECIKICRHIIEIDDPPAKIYGLLGLAYMKKWKKALAIDYLTIATEMVKTENDTIDGDFSELIARLKGELPQEDSKKYVRMKVSDFYDKHNDYNIANLENIISLVSSGISIDEACQNYNLNDNERCIVYLIFAKECYKNGDFKNGNIYLKVVEKTKGKGRRVRSLLEEITRNKRFYKNRVTE